jgi:hypothetical protein
MTQDELAARIAELEARATAAEAREAALMKNVQWAQDCMMDYVVENAKLREALEWYGEQARLCRLIHSEGDAGRHALANDGGIRARKALETDNG